MATLSILLSVDWILKKKTIFVFVTYFWKYCDDISRKNNKGVLDRPWTIWKVWKAISSTLKFQSTGKCSKMDFLMSSKTKSVETLGKSAKIN